MVMWLCVPGVAIGLFTLLLGSVASSQIRGSEGSQRGSGIALLGIILGAFPSLFIFALWFINLLGEAVFND